MDSSKCKPFLLIDISSLAYTSFRALRQQLKRSTEEPSWPSTKKKWTRPTPKEIDKTSIRSRRSIDVWCNKGIALALQRAGVFLDPICASHFLSVWVSSMHVQNKTSLVAFNEQPIFLLGFRLPALVMLVVLTCMYLATTVFPVQSLRR